MKIFLKIITLGFSALSGQSSLACVDHAISSIRSLGIGINSDFQPTVTNAQAIGAAIQSCDRPSVRMAALTELEKGMVTGYSNPTVDVAAVVANVCKKDKNCAIRAIEVLGKAINSDFSPTSSLAELLPSVVAKNPYSEVRRKAVTMLAKGIVPGYADPTVTVASQAPGICGKDRSCIAEAIKVLARGLNSDNIPSSQLSKILVATVSENPSSENIRAAAEALGQCIIMGYNSPTLRCQEAIVALNGLRTPSGGMDGDFDWDSGSLAALFAELAKFSYAAKSGVYLRISEELGKIQVNESAPLAGQYQAFFAQALALTAAQPLIESTSSDFFSAKVVPDYQKLKTSFLEQNGITGLRDIPRTPQTRDMALRLIHSGMLSLKSLIADEAARADFERATADIGYALATPAALPLTIARLKMMTSTLEKLGLSPRLTGLALFVRSLIEYLNAENFVTP